MRVIGTLSRCRGVFAHGAVLLALELAMGRPGNLRAQDGPAGVWEDAGVSGDVRQLFASGTGTMLAATGTDLFRSDDGSAWEVVPLPTLTPRPAIGSGSAAPVRKVAVHPIDPAVVYAEGADELYRTSDGGTNWTRVADTPAKIALSPADPRLLYLASIEPNNGISLARSRDGGTSWETLPFPSTAAQPGTMTGNRCAVVVLAAHPTDANRLFAAGDCRRGGRLAAEISRLVQSSDQGVTWTDVGTPGFAGAGKLIGGEGRLAGKFYLAASAIGSGPMVLRSDDDGYTWVRDEHPFVQGRNLMPVLAYDRGTGRIFETRQPGPDQPAGLQSTDDGGATWTFLGAPDSVPPWREPEVADLAISPDGQLLYVATPAGLSRLRLRMAE